ncbi:uncharacterized protein LOC116344103 isoform X1 [Contarinia nasturtii]|uniref:uncharacterized protein LOC116344103 isoform X1 n=1 Tax=Contarinia nasturtii TaxID=265458 RepID=UPI0012D3C279|nr:uncharacterized protein LOC116344103 isoform X1 [Contarinia nasturtii]
MAITRDVFNLFSKIAILILLIGVVQSSVVNKFVNPLTNPCYGAGNQRVRALTYDSFLADCNQYVQCENDQMDQPLECPSGTYFDADSGECVHNRDVCFRCPNKEYALVSVPNVHQQFILCFKGKPLLSACEGDLYFDGSPGVHQCNFKWGAEFEGDFENQLCPPVGNEPKYVASEGVYYVCYGQQRPLRLECPNGLMFSEDKGICENPNSNLEMVENDPAEE